MGWQDHSKNIRVVGKHYVCKAHTWMMNLKEIEMRNAVLIMINNWHNLGYNSAIEKCKMSKCSKKLMKLVESCHCHAFNCQYLLKHVIVHSINHCEQRWTTSRWRFWSFVQLPLLTVTDSWQDINGAHMSH